MKLVMVTGNENKLREARHILRGYELEQARLDIDEVQGEPEHIIRKKADAAFEILRKPLIVEDTSVGLGALSGFPGPYIKELVTKNPVSAVPRMLSGFSDKSAVGTAWVAYIEEKGNPVVFSGEVRGRIVEPRGESGFAWDLVFQPEGHSKTFAEMSTEEKNRISHRMKAFRKLGEFLDEKNLEARKQ